MALFPLRNFKVAPRQTISAAVFKTCVSIRVQSGRYISRVGWASRFLFLVGHGTTGKLHLRYLYSPWPRAASLQRPQRPQS